MQAKYENIITKYKTQLEQDSKLFDRLGYAKILAILILIVCITLLFASGFAVLVILAAITFFVASVVLWVWHYRLDNKVRYAKGIIAICNKHINRITGEWAKFDDIGREFIDFSHPYACDLDIVGAKSFFQFLNTTHTWHGRQAFAGDLLRPSYTITEIKERQEAITELSKDIDFANDTQYYLSQMGASLLEAELVEALTDNAPLKLRLAGGSRSKWARAVKFLISFIPVATVVLLMAGAIFQIRPLFGAGVVFAIVQAVLWYVEKNVIYRYLGLMDRLPYKLGKYVKVIDILTNRDFSSAKLNQIKSKLAVASEAVKALESISSKLSFRSNPLVYIALNILLLWDIHCAFLLERWKAKYSYLAGQWFAAIGEFESLVSFSHLPNVCGSVCLPMVSEGGKELDATGLGHPLLSNSSRVSNNVRFDNNIFIISGSNMSGKTTFMRTVGVNLLLARTGSFVCASEMTCSRFDIITSMRVADDLNEGVSTFYAELKRVKLILDMAKENPNLIFLIDEIFKGTNSVDRLAGADAVISKLERLNAAGMVSTHDLELCKLAGLHDRIINYSFCEHYQDGKIHFDYIMRKGQSKTTNARFLMEMVGI